MFDLVQELSVVKVKYHTELVTVSPLTFYWHVDIERHLGQATATVCRHQLVPVTL